MTSPWKLLQYAAFGLLVVFAVFGSAFVIAEAATDPGGVSAVLLSASWVVPMVALAGYPWWRPDPAARVLTVVAALVASLVVLDVVADIVPDDEIGPVGSIAAFAVAVALGFRGLHRAALAGWLLLVGASTLAGVLAKVFEAGAGAQGAGGSAGAVAIPVLIIGGLFLFAKVDLVVAATRAQWSPGRRHFVA